MDIKQHAATAWRMLPDFLLLLRTRITHTHTQIHTRRRCREGNNKKKERKKRRQSISPRVRGVANIVRNNRFIQLIITGVPFISRNDFGFKTEPSIWWSLGCRHIIGLAIRYSAGPIFKSLIISLKFAPLSVGQFLFWKIVWLICVLFLSDGYFDSTRI